MTDILRQIKLIQLPNDQYFREETEKHQIYLHHTAGNANAAGVIEDWARTEIRIATSFIIAGQPPHNKLMWKDGQLYQCFSSKYWGYHLGLKATKLPPKSLTPMALQRGSIGIEICNWGWLTKRVDGKFINYVGGILSPDEVIDLGYDYRGYRYWHKYTDAQIATTKLLLQYLCEYWDIPTEYKGLEMFDLDDRAFRGESGIFAHCSVRPDKWDISPQPKLIEMLESL